MNIFHVVFQKEETVQVTTWTEERAVILAQAEKIKAGKDFKVIAVISQK